MTTQGEEWDAYRSGCAERWLDHVGTHRRRVEALRALVDAKRAELDGLHAIDYSRAGGRTPGVHGDDAMARAVSDLQESIGEYCAELRDLTAEQADAHARLSRMPDPTGAAALSMHYLAGVEWADVAERLGYAERHVYRIRDDALVSAYDVMPTEWRDPMEPAM